jgi:tetratricopeptide (TPR) repeat protein
LTNFEQDQEIWSDSYQVSAADIPRLSEGIHSQLRGALDLGEEEGEREGEGANRATLSDNDEATEYYVKALVLLKNPDFEMETINHAIDLLGTATRLDPHFTLAFAELTKAQALLSFNGKRYQGNLARTALQIAQGLAPDSREVLVAEAFTYFRVDHNYEAAIDTFFRASGVPPDQIAELRDGEILQGIGFCRRRQGDLEGATDALKVAFDLDPLDASLAGELAKTYMARRDHGKAETQFDLSLDVEPNQPQLAGDRAMNFLWGSPCPSEHRSCAVKDARLLLHRAEVEDEKKGYLVYFDFLLDLFAAADLQGEARLAAFQKALDRLDEVPPAALNSQDRYSLFWRRAFLQRRLGKSEIAEAQAAWYAPLLDDEIRNTPDYAYPYAYRAMAHALLGERQEALVIASQAVQIADDKDQYSSPRQNQSCLSGRLAAQTRPLLLPGW